MQLGASTWHLPDDVSTKHVAPAVDSPLPPLGINPLRARPPRLVASVRDMSVRSRVPEGLHASQVARLIRSGSG
jgi:hypothetical protein